MIPFSAAHIRLFHLTYVNDVYAQVAPGQDATAVMSQITSLLHTRHHIQAKQSDDFRIRNNEQINPDPRSKPTPR